MSSRSSRAWVAALQLGAAAVGLAPVAAFATILLSPLWGWVEARLGVEALGHSGPAGWCFLAVYAALLGPVAVLLIRRARRRPAAL